MTDTSPTQAATSEATPLYRPRKSFLVNPDDPKGPKVVHHIIQVHTGDCWKPLKDEKGKPWRSLSVDVRDAHLKALRDATKSLPPRALRTQRAYPVVPEDNWADFIAWAEKQNLPMDVVSNPLSGVGQEAQWAYLADQGISNNHVAKLRRKQQHIERMTRDEFRDLAREKGWTYRDMAERWRMTEGYIGLLARDEGRAVHFDDALRGLPKKRKTRGTP